MTGFLGDRLYLDDGDADAIALMPDTSFRMSSANLKYVSMVETRLEREYSGYNPDDPAATALADRLARVKMVSQCTLIWLQKGPEQLEEHLIQQTST